MQKFYPVGMETLYLGKDDDYQGKVKIYTLLSPIYPEEVANFNND